MMIDAKRDQHGFDPGRLKIRLVIEAPVDVPDGQGGIARSYIAQETAWASVLQHMARTDVQADAAGATLRMRVIMRAHPALTLEHRLNDNGRIYRIIALVPRGDGRFIAIDAVQWQR